MYPYQGGPMRPITKKTIRDQKAKLKDMRFGQWAVVYSGMYGIIAMEKVDQNHPVRFHIGTRLPKPGAFKMNEKTYLSYMEARDRLVDLWMNSPVYAPKAMPAQKE